MGHGFDPTLMKGMVRGVAVQAPYSANPEALAKLLVEIELLCRRHLMKPVAITLVKFP